MSSQALNDAAVGSRRCPTPAAVAAIFNRLRRALTVSRHRGAVAYHNAYTLYTVAVIGYGTGIRAVRDPLPDGERMDADALVAVIADKRVAGADRVRVVPLARTVLRQIRRYEAHLRVVAPQLHAEVSHRDAELRLGFFLEPDARAVRPAPIRPATLLPRLRALGMGAVNAHRHYLRTELAARGLPPKYVNAVMGHWPVGASPVGYFSGLPWDDYLVRTRRAIDALLREAGVVAIRSVYVRGGGDD